MGAARRSGGGRGAGKQWCIRRDEWWGMWPGCTCALCVAMAAMHPAHNLTARRLLLGAAGGEFFSHLKARGKLGEDAARLYAGEVG